MNNITKIGAAMAATLIVLPAQAQTDAKIQLTTDVYKRYGNITVVVRRYGKYDKLAECAAIVTSNAGQLRFQMSQTGTPFMSFVAPTLARPKSALFGPYDVNPISVTIDSGKTLTFRKAQLDLYDNNYTSVNIEKQKVEFLRANHSIVIHQWLMTKSWSLQNGMLPKALWGVVQCYNENK